MAASLDTKEKFLELRANGKSLSAIASELAISKTTVVKWSKEYQVELANYEALAYDDMLKRYKISKEHGLQLWAELLDMAQTELKERGLKDLNTLELIRIAETMSAKLANEVKPIMLKDNPHQVEDPYAMVSGGATKTAYDNWQV